MQLKIIGSRRFAESGFRLAGRSGFLTILRLSLEGGRTINRWWWTPARPMPRGAGPGRNPERSTPPPRRSLMRAPSNSAAVVPFPKMVSTPELACQSERPDVLLYSTLDWCSMDDIKEQIKLILLKSLRITDASLADLRDDQPLMGGELEIDSIDVLQLILEIERHFGIKLVRGGKFEKEEWASLNALAAAIENRLVEARR